MGIPDSAYSACFRSERFLIAVNKIIADLSPGASEGDNDTNFCQKSRGWTPSCNQQDFQEICERCEAKHPPVMFPNTAMQSGIRGVGDKYGAREPKEIKEECVVDIRYMRLWKSPWPHPCGINVMRKEETICFTE